VVNGANLRPSLNSPLIRLRDIAPLRDKAEQAMAERILIVDDDPVQRRLLENMVIRSGFEPVIAESGDMALVLMAESEPRIDCVVLDLVMPDLDGLGVLAKMREGELNIPVIVQTAHGGIDNVVSAMRAGAVDFVVKPVSLERLHVSLRNALATRALQGELNRLKRSRAGTLTFKDILTRSPRMQAVLRTAEKAARSAIPVLIEGESGVGKELIARAIHGSGERRAKPFIAVNCGAIPENLVESVLFGHEKGAFTGATERHAGKFVEASGGTLFLDEVGELPPPSQVKLLRAIQEGEVEPVGAKRPVKVDVRIISATNRDLIADVRAGRFREDLFYRLHVFPISVPPLRARPEDVPDLAKHFLIRFAAEEGKRVDGITAEALKLLASFRWPGNVRQLENAVFRAVVLADSETIGIGEFPQIAAQSAAAGVMETPLVPDTSPESPAARIVAGDAMPAPQLMNAHAASDTPAGCTLSLIDAAGDVLPLEAIEAAVIRFAIVHYRGQMSEVARKLQIGRSTLYRKLDALGLSGGGDGRGKTDVAGR
jgi:DNA-binding NtrC family response regulator